MIEIISPSNNETLGGSRAAQTFTTLAQWNKAYIAGVFEWLTGEDTDGGIIWPDTDGTGSTVRIYQIAIWLRTSSLKFSVDVKNHHYAEYPDAFHPLDEFGVPMIDELFTINVGESPTYSAHLMLPLGFSWVDPTTGLRDYAQGNRTIIARTQPDTAGDYEEAIRSFVIDIRPPNKPVLEQVSQIVTTGISKTTSTTRKFTIKGVAPNLDMGSFLITIKNP